MLFGYPAEATAENWFHDCLFEMLQTIHANLQHGVPIPPWPEIIPEVHRDTLRTRTGIEDRLIEYVRIAETLTSDEIDLVNISLYEQNQIDQLLSGVCDCATIDDLPGSIQQAIKDLFGFGFNLLLGFNS